MLVETDSLVLIEADWLADTDAEVLWLAESLLVLVEPEPLPELLLALIEADTLLLKLVLADWLALIEADTLLLMLVLADWLALIEAEVLSLNDTLTDLLSETESLALTDSR